MDCHGAPRPRARRQRDVAVGDRSRYRRCDRRRHRRVRHRRRRYPDAMARRDRAAAEPILRFQRERTRRSGYGALTMSAPVADLAELLRTMRPVLNPGVYVFASLPHGTDVAALQPLATFREAEGLSVVVEQGVAAAAGLT